MILKLFFEKKILLVCHENTDLDSFCSAAIFKEFLSNNKINSTICVPSHINEQTTNFAKEYNIDFVVNPELEKFNFFILFDFNDFEQFGKMRLKFEELLKNKKLGLNKNVKNNFNDISLFVFDHHVVEESSISKYFSDATKLSTTELLFELIGKDFNEKMFFYACIGMIEDTGRFLVGSTNFFNAFSKCLEGSKKSYANIFKIAKHDPPECEKIAFLKALKRAEIIKIKNTIIVLSNISFYQGAVATKLLEFGADVSIVCGIEKNGITNLSARAETFFKEKNNFNLMNHLIIPLQKKFGGEAGGHSGAAQWKGFKSKKIVLKESLKILNDFINKK